MPVEVKIPDLVRMGVITEFEANKPIKKLAKKLKKDGVIEHCKSAYDLPEMKKFMDEHPDASVALKQLKFTKPWYATHNTIAVARPMGDAIQAVVTGKKSVDEAVTEAQKKAVELLRPYNKARGYTQE